MKRALVFVAVAACGQPAHVESYRDVDYFHDSNPALIRRVAELRRAHAVEPGVHAEGEPAEACKRRDPDACAELAVTWLRGDADQRWDAQALLYVSCMDGASKAACRLAVKYFFDPGLKMGLEIYACETLMDVDPCLSLHLDYRACEAGHQPSCDAVAAQQAERERERVAAEEAAREYERTHPEEREDDDDDEDVPTTPSYDPPSSDDEPDYLNEDECRMVVGLACTHLYYDGRDLTPYYDCLAAGEGSIEQCTRIRCGARYYNCIAQVYSESELRACTDMSDQCGIDPP